VRRTFCSSQVEVECSVKESVNGHLARGEMQRLGPAGGQFSREAARKAGCPGTSPVRDFRLCYMLRQQTRRGWKQTPISIRSSRGICNDNARVGSGPGLGPGRSAGSTPWKTILLNSRMAGFRLYRTRCDARRPLKWRAPRPWRLRAASERGQSGSERDASVAVSS
jgi:hypothetical protein